MHNLIRLLECFYGTPWAIADSYLKSLEIQLLDCYRQQTENGLVESFGAENRAMKTVATASGVGVIPIRGAIGHRASFLSDFFGWPTTERIGQTLQQMVDDPSVGAIVLDIDSPGGMAVGNEELHQQMMRSRGKKPIIAQVTGMAASAAYYIASAADEIVMTQSSEVGSIGTVMVHGDFSEAYKAAGIKPTVIKAGKYKWEGHPYEPLSDEAQAEFQRQVDAHYDMFVKAVARGRDVSVSTVKSDFGQGRLLMGKDAVAVKMADRIGAMDDVLAKFGARSVSGGARMDDETPAVENTDADETDRQETIDRLKASIKTI